MSLARAVVTIGGLTLASRIAGFARDILMASLLGAGPVADAFVIALKLPNLFRRIFAEGAFAISFVPLFTAEMAGPGRPRAIAFAEQALAFLLPVLLGVTAAAMAAMPLIIHLIAPGFAQDGERLTLAIAFARMAFPYLLLISLTALLGGVLNGIDRFAPFAAAPVLFNAVLIGALLVGRYIGPAPGPALALGVTVAGFVQLVWLAAWCRRAGIRLELRRPRLTPPLGRLFRLMGPGVVAAGAVQINVFLSTLLASLLPAGAVSYLYYADRLYQLPLGIIGVALSTALLPVLARQLQGGAAAAAAETQQRAIAYSLLLGLPAAVALVAVPLPIATVLFERGAFGAEAARATAGAIGAFALGIPAYVLIKVLATGYFARQDTATPLRITLVATAANLAVALALIGWLGHVGIALASSAAAWLNAVLLARGLARRGLLPGAAALAGDVLRLVPALAGLAVVLLVLAWLCRPLFAADGGLAVLALGLTLASAAAAYFALVQLTGAARLDLLWAQLVKKGA